MNYSPKEFFSPKPIDYEQIHKDITIFLIEFDEYEKQSRKTKLIINCPPIHTMEDLMKYNLRAQ